MWSRNLVNLFVSPLRPTEFATSVLLMGAIRTLLGMVPVSLLAWWFFGFSVYSMGLALAAFFASLILFGWAIGIAVCGLIMRYGMGAESAAIGRASGRERGLQYVVYSGGSVSLKKTIKRDT